MWHLLPQAHLPSQSPVCSERYSRSCLRCRVRYLATSHPSNLQLICKLVYRTVLHLSICELIANRRCSARSGTVQRAPSNGNSFSRSTLLKKNLKKFAFWVRVFPILCTYISERTFQPQLHTNGERRFERYVRYRNTSRARQAKSARKHPLDAASARYCCGRTRATMCR